tara:strand:+ start:228 stop:641 length:414 start_codon:yes stop_codon:yes gene_type:complete
MQPSDTHQRSQRASRPVPFDARGDLWAAVQQGVVLSRDLNARMEFDPITPPPARPPPLPYQRQLPPMSAPSGGNRPAPGVVVRAPLGEVPLNVLRTEIRSLEKENDALKKHVALQDRVIMGFCTLHVFERENQSGLP